METRKCSVRLKLQRGSCESQDHNHIKVKPDPANRIASLAEHALAKIIGTMLMSCSEIIALYCNVIAFWDIHNQTCEVLLLVQSAELRQDVRGDHCTALFVESTKGGLSDQAAGVIGDLN